MMGSVGPATNHERHDIGPTESINASSLPPYLLADELMEMGVDLKAFLARETMTLAEIESTTPIIDKAASPLPPSRISSLVGPADYRDGLDLVKFEEFLSTMTFDGDGNSQSIHSKPAKKLCPPTLHHRDALPFGKLQHLLARIEEQIAEVEQRRALRQLLLDSQPRHSKWFDAHRPGQAELYDELERVLTQLRHYLPHSGPFLHRVSKKEVPDYYDIIKRPMDLGTMAKKLRAHLYRRKEDFERDLQLIYRNCYTYNTDSTSILRRHADSLRGRWIQLMKNVPNIVVTILEPSPTPPPLHTPLSESTINGSTTANTTTRMTTSTSKTGQPTTTGVANQVVDEIDSLLNIHLEHLSDTDDTSAPRAVESTTTMTGLSVSSASHSGIIINSSHGSGTSSNVCSSTDTQPTSNDNEKSLDLKEGEEYNLHWLLPARSSKLMARSGEIGTLRELVWFHQAIPHCNLAKDSGIKNVSNPLLLAKTTTAATNSSSSSPTNEPTIPLPDYLVQTIWGFKRLREAIGSSTTMVKKSSDAQSPLTTIFSSPSDSAGFTAQTAKHQLARIVAWLTLQVGFETSLNSTNAILSSILDYYLEELCIRLKQKMETIWQVENKDGNDQIPTLIQQMSKGVGIRGRDLQRMLIIRPAVTQNLLEKAINAVQERRAKLEAEARMNAHNREELEKHTAGDEGAIPESDLDLEMLLEDEPSDDEDDNEGVDEDLIERTTLIRPNSRSPIMDAPLVGGGRGGGDREGEIFPLGETLSGPGEPSFVLFDRKRQSKSQIHSDIDEEAVIGEDQSSSTTSPAKMMNKSNTSRC